MKFPLSSSKISRGTFRDFRMKYSTMLPEIAPITIPINKEVISIFQK